MRCFYSIFLIFLFSPTGFCQGFVAPYNEEPDVLVVQFSDGTSKGGIITHYDARPGKELYEVLMSPGGGRYSIKRSGLITRVSNGDATDRGRANTQLSSWRYLQHDKNILRISRGTNVVICIISDRDNPYFGQVMDYNPRRGYTVTFFGPGPGPSRDPYSAVISPSLVITSTNVPTLQNQMVFRMNVMSLVGPPRTFPY